ncbi:MAG: glutamyl-tRNA reductase [Acidobacteriota bacterium]
MRFLITGLNHRTAPVEVREKVAFDHNALGPALAGLMGRKGVAEGVILSTCNRVEIAVAVENGYDPRSDVDRFLSESGRVSTDDIAPHLYHFTDEEAIHHLFRVAASLDSMVVGEPQILGQLKAAYAAAKAQGAVTGFLELVLTRAFSVAKRVRTETGIGESAVSVSYAAVEMAREIFGSLADKRVMIVGAGKMSELAAQHLHRSGATRIYVTNRTLERAREMAELFQGSIVEYDRFLAVLPEMDIVITSSGAPFYIIQKSHMRRAIEVRKNKPVFLIDIAVPRNIEPSVNEVDNVFLYDIDDLQRVVETNVGERRKRAEQAERIIEDEVARMLQRLKAREVAPTIVSLQEQLEQMRQAELARVRGKLGTLTAQQEEALDALTRGLMAKIAHGPIAELRRQAGQPDGVHVIEAIRKAFRLES